MERETRLELATSSLARKHSTTELLPHHSVCIFKHNSFSVASIFSKNFLSVDDYYILRI